LEGIYAVQEDTLKICVSGEIDKKPKTFSAREGSGAALINPKACKEMIFEQQGNSAKTRHKE
jgi:hypothetical protein